MRYVERNPLRANLVARAEDWPWSSASHRLDGDRQGILSRPPIDLPSNWLEVVDEAQTPDELAALRRSFRRGAPFGAAPWVEETAQRLGIEDTLRPRGRPKRACLEPIPSP